MRLIQTRRSPVRAQTTLNENDNAGQPRRQVVNERLLYRVEEVAEMLSLGRSKTYQMVATGALPSVRLGRCVRIPANVLRQWIEEQFEGTMQGSSRKVG